MRQHAATLLVVIGQLAGAGSAAAQEAPVPPAVPEHYGVGAVGAVGWPGPMVAVRVSGPMAERFGLDLDVGRGRESGEPTLAIGAQVRWLRTERRADGTSDYAIFGVMVMDETTRSDIRFPDARFITTERHKRLSGQIGYGFDWQARGGTRLGLELAGGGTGESFGFRLFLRIFTVWGRPIQSAS